MLPEIIIHRGGAAVKQKIRPVLPAQLYDLVHIAQVHLFNLLLFGGLFHIASFPIRFDPCSDLKSLVCFAWITLSGQKRFPHIMKTENREIITSQFA